MCTCVYVRVRPKAMGGYYVAVRTDETAEAALHSLDTTLLVLTRAVSLSDIKIIPRPCQNFASFIFSSCADSRKAQKFPTPRKKFPAIYGIHVTQGFIQRGGRPGISPPPQDFENYDVISTLK